MTETTPLDPMRNYVLTDRKRKALDDLWAMLDDFVKGERRNIAAKPAVIACGDAVQQGRSMKQEIGNINKPDREPSGSPHTRGLAA